MKILKDKAAAALMAMGLWFLHGPSKRHYYSLRRLPNGVLRLDTWPAGVSVDVADLTADEARLERLEAENRRLATTNMDQRVMLRHLRTTRDEVLEEVATELEGLSEGETMRMEIAFVAAARAVRALKEKP